MKRMLSALLSAVIAFSMSVPAFAEDTPMTDIQNEYYSETEYIAAEDMRTPYSSEELGEPIGQVIQTVYVRETFDDNGMILESRLMNKQEADDYKAEVAQRLRSGEQVRVAPNGMRSFPADDSTSEGELTITLTVSKSGSTGYKGKAEVQWTNGIWILPDGEERPSVGKDYLAITWGGKGELKQKSKSISGSYQFNQGDISFSQAKADSYAGYCWQFDESKWVLLTRYYTDSISANVVIDKTYDAKRDKETTMKLTYIHTFDKLSGSIEFSADSTGKAAAGVTLSTVKDQWQIQVDISGLVY